MSKSRELSLEENQIANALYQRYKELKKTSNITFGSISKECGWSTASASEQFLKGRTPIGIKAFFNLCNALGVEPSQVLPNYNEFYKLNNNDDLLNIGASDDTTWKSILDHIAAEIHKRSNAAFYQSEVEGKKELLEYFYRNAVKELKR